MSYKVNANTEEKIKLAKDDSVDRLYESKQNQRTIRVLTVCMYVLCVSLAAIILSIYYLFLWTPLSLHAANNETRPRECDRIIIPQSIAVRLANSSIVSAEVFYERFFELLQKEVEKSEKHHERQTNLKSEKIVDYSQKASLEEIFKKLANSNYDTNSEPKSHKKKSSRREKHKMNNKKSEMPKDDEDFYEHSGNQNDMTTIYPTTTDLNDTTIVFDDNEMEEIVAT